MTRRIIGFSSAALFTLSLSTAWAQERPTQDTGPSGPASSGDRGGGGGASSAGAGGGGVASAGGGGGSAVSSSGGGSSAGSSGVSTSGFGEGRVFGSDSGRRSAPARDPGFSYSGDGGSPQRTAPRGGNGEGSSRPAGGEGTSRPSGPSGGEGGGRAVPRGEGSRAGDGGQGTRSRTGGSREATPMSADGPNEAPTRSAVPAYSRPREGRTAVGTAVERGDAVRGGQGGGIAWYSDPYFGYYGGYSPYGYYSSRYHQYGYPSYGYGLGYFYDPFMFGGFGYDPYSYGGGYAGGGGSGYYRGRSYDTGTLRLKVRPADAKVYVDGYFVGVVDSFDGVFQRLAVEAGTHRIEIRADGYEPAQFEVMITPGETVTYKGDLKRSIQ